MGEDKKEENMRKGTEKEKKDKTRKEKTREEKKRMKGKSKCKEIFFINLYISLGIMKYE